MNTESKPPQKRTPRHGDEHSSAAQRPHGARPRLTMAHFKRYTRAGVVCQPDGKQISRDPKLMCPLCRAPHSVRQHNAHAADGVHPCDGGILSPASLCHEIASWAQTRMKEDRFLPQELDVRKSPEILRKHGVDTLAATDRPPVGNRSRSKVA